MSLVDDIIKQAAEDSTSLSGLLRKLLVLAHQIENQRLKDWVSAELNGYPDSKDLPDYRVMRAFAKGLFVGSYQRQINNQPIPAAVLKSQHRVFAEKVFLKQPIAAYRLEGDEQIDLMMEWPADLVLIYQDKFFPGQDMILNRAWQAIPRQAINGLNDVVRTKILQFALELKDASIDFGNDPVKVPAEKVDSQVIYNIYGGTNIIAAEAKDFELINSTVVHKNNVAELAAAFKSIGIERGAVLQLEHAIAEDQKVDNGKKTVGAKTSEWIAGIGKTVGKEGLKVASNAAQAAALAWIKQHLGIP